MSVSTCISTALLYEHSSVAAVASAYAQEQCPQPLGNADRNTYARTDDDLFLLDVDHPAECDGTVEQLRYCVYRPSNALNPTHEAYVAVFRQNISADVFVRVSDFVTLQQENRDIDMSFVFDCFTVAVGFSDIQEGDVFGVCQINPSGVSRRLLNVVGTGGPQNSSLYAEDSDENCIQLSQVNTSTGVGGLQQTYVLHIYANVSTGKSH